MTSHWYAIADAGGNIYPGTFCQDAIDAQWAHAIKETQRHDPQLTMFAIGWLDNAWPYYLGRGDHVVKCVVETNETVKVISKEMV